MHEIAPGSDIFTVDAHYDGRAQHVSIHLVRSRGRLAVIDTGTQFSIPQVQATLDELGLGFEQVDYVILTHIHLDHAGGAGALMQRCRNAQLVVHPRGARHMAEPGKLVAGTVAVYGQAGFDRLYGEILPINRQRMLIPREGETIELAGRPLTFFDTPGHASHHHCIFDAQTRSVFTGDTMGLSYPQLRHKGALCLMPTTTPVQFDPDALHASMDKVMSYQPEWLYLTHFSGIQPGARHIAGLHSQIDDFVQLTGDCAQANDANFVATLKQALHEYLVHACCTEVPQLERETVVQLSEFDAHLNAQGLVFWWNHRRPN